MIVQITVKNKIAFVTAVENVVCNNSDYAVVFSFDEEWADRETKTARFKWNGKYTDVAFSGNTVMMPVIKDTRMVEIGVYAGDIYTTTAAVLPVLGSILSGEAEQDAPTEDVYNQIIELINSKPHLSESDVQGIIAEYLAAHPETDPTVPAWAKAETKPTYTADEVGAYTKAEVDAAIATAETETDAKLLSYRTVADSYSKSETDTLLASAGKVKTVNGVEPDASGNIEIDAVDVPQTASVGDVLTVEEVDDNGKPTKWKAATKKQANWEQNDSTAEDYVQGRTHWIEHDMLTEIVSETTVGLTVEEGARFAVADWWDLLDYLWLEGSKWVVKFNGVEYPALTAMDDGEDGIVFGNQSIVNSSAEDTGEPFCFCQPQQIKEVFQLYVAKSGIYTFSLYRPEDIGYHKIPPEYIEEMYHTTKTEVDISEAFQQVNVPSGQQDYNLPLAYGQTWNVVAHISTTDIRTFKNVKVGFTNNGQVLIGADPVTDEFPFYIYPNYSSCEADLTGVSGTYIVETVTQIPKKYMNTDAIGDGVYKYFSQHPLVLSREVSNTTTSVTLSEGELPPIILIRSKYSDRDKPINVQKVLSPYGESYSIISSKTNEELIASERPYGTMVLVWGPDGCVCINPR